MVGEPPIEKIRRKLGDIRAAKALQILEKEDRIVVQIPEDLLLSNEDFGRIHERLAAMGGQYLKGAKAWEIPLA